MITVGLTGNLASGKSEVAKLFKKKKAVIVDADEISRDLTKKGQPLFKAIIKMFGEEYLDEKGHLNRRKLAELVFSKPSALKKLNTIIHPGVILETYKKIDQNRHKKGVLVMDVPLLFESRMEKMADFTVLVKASESTMISRATKRGIPKELVKKILASQWPVKKKEAISDFVIDNDGTPKQLALAVNQVYKEILASAKQRAVEYGQKI